LISQSRGLGDVYKRQVMTPLQTVLIAFVVVVVMMQLWDRL
jgi:hypothetical protein